MSTRPGKTNLRISESNRQAYAAARTHNPQLTLTQWVNDKIAFALQYQGQDLLKLSLRAMEELRRELRDMAAQLTRAVQSIGHDRLERHVDDLAEQVRLELGPPGANAGKFTVASLAENYSFWPDRMT